MRVVFSTVGRFRFELAHELNKVGYLERIFTGYPMWKVEAELRSKTVSFPWIVMPQMALYRYGFEDIANRLSLPATCTLDHWVAKRLPDCDIFVALSQSGLYTFRVAKHKGIKTVCERGSAHIVVQNAILSHEYEQRGIPFNGIPQWAIEKELREYAEADLVKVPSSFAYQTFIEQGIAAEKIVTIPLGVNLEMFKPVLKEDKTFRIIYVGALSLRKGVPYLLEAVAGLNLPNAEVWLVGSEQEEIRPILADYVDHFRYCGVVPRAKLKWYYSQASVLVMPSLEDGFGQVMSQALACGIPVIATTNTGADDLFTNGVEGFIIPICNPTAISEKILYLYENPEVRDRMAGAALQKVQSIGGWELHGQQTIQVFQKLLQTPMITEETDEVAQEMG